MDLKFSLVAEDGVGFLGRAVSVYGHNHHDNDDASSNQRPSRWAMDEQKAGYDPAYAPDRDYAHVTSFPLSAEDTVYATNKPSEAGVWSNSMSPSPKDTEVFTS